MKLSTISSSLTYISQGPIKEEEKRDKRGGERRRGQESGGREKENGAGKIFEETG